MKALPTPFYEADGITLYCGEARDILPLLSIVDAVVTDPPYGETSLDWDVWPEMWPSWVVPLTSQLWCFGSFRMFWDHRADFNDWKLAQDLVWEKHNGGGLHSDRFRRVHEQVIHLYRGEWQGIHKEPPTVTVQEERVRGTFTRGMKPAHFGDVSDASYEYDGKRLMRSVIPVKSCHGYAVNETQKPEGIVDPLLSYSVPPGGIVLDPFCGSGTTLAVARSQGKRAIGIEKREGQCASIVKRLSQREFCLL